VSTVEETNAMTNRREFLQTGVSVSALPLVTNGFLSSADASVRIRRNNLRLHSAIYDDRYAAGLSFADAVGGFGTPVRALKNGDVTDLWYGELDLLWRERPTAIAGLTQFGPMFVLEQLGRGRGLRSVLRVEHQVLENGELAHVMTGAPETLTLAKRLASQGLDWAVAAAVLASHCSGECPAPATETITLPGTKPALTRAGGGGGAVTVPETVVHYYKSIAIQQGAAVPWDGPLYSWVIAPAAPA
jgi:hypothetical protein